MFELRHAVGAFEGDFGASSADDAVGKSDCQSTIGLP
jgi:hypothetical protein